MATGGLLGKAARAGYQRGKAMITARPDPRPPASQDANGRGAPADAGGDAAPSGERRTQWRHRCEAWGAGLFFGIFGALPIGAASALGGWLASRIGPRLAISRRARRHIATALPALSATQVEAALRGMWDNLGRVAAEYPHLRHIRVFSPGSRVEIRGLDHVERAITDGRRMILFSAHLANWEIAALAATQYGIDIAQIYRSANNPLVDAIIRRCRGAHGEFIPKEAVGRRAVAALRRGAHLAILVDQKLNEGIPVGFFGRPAMTAPTLAVLALRYRCDVLPARVERLAGAHFRLTIGPRLALPDSGNRNADVATLMAAVNATLEGWIRERPEQWFWLHRRWPDAG